MLILTHVTPCYIVRFIVIFRNIRACQCPLVYLNVERILWPRRLESYKTNMIEPTIYQGKFVNQRRKKTALFLFICFKQLAIKNQNEITTSFLKAIVSTSVNELEFLKLSKKIHSGFPHNHSAWSKSRLDNQNSG